MGSSPYSPVLPLVICLPPRPLTGALTPQRSSEAFWWWIRLLPPTQNAHPSTSVAHSEKPQAVLCNVILNLTEAKLGFLKVSTPMVSHVNGGNIPFDLAVEIPCKALNGIIFDLLYGIMK